MAKKRLSGFRKPLDSGERREVRLAIIKYGKAGDQEFAECSCGKPFIHPREKVREDAIDRHIRTKHRGRGVRL